MNKIIANRFFSPITFAQANLSDLHDGYLFFKHTTAATPIDSETFVTQKNYAPTLTASDTDFSEMPNVLEEVVIYGKRKPYSVMQQVIDALGSNYPGRAFSSEMSTNVTAKVSNKPVLDFDFVASQYDLSYVNHTDRSLKSVQQIKWNISDDFQSESLREYHGLVYNSPIQYAPFLKKGKFKKFRFVLEKTKRHNNQEVYVISFSSPRHHSSFTRRVYLSNYSGYLYINTNDFAVVKIFENWEVTEFPDAFRQGYSLKNALSEYTAKEYANESTLTDFTKIGNHYFISYSQNAISGNLYNAHNKKAPFTLTAESFWTNFDTQNPKKIKANSEEHRFKNVKHHPAFWQSR